jgi:hypothetical protein
VEVADGIALIQVQFTSSLVSFVWSGFFCFSSHGAAFQPRLMHNSAFQLAAIQGEFS